MVGAGDLLTAVDAVVTFNDLIPVLLPVGPCNLVVALAALIPELGPNGVCGLKPILEAGALVPEVNPGDLVFIKEFAAITAPAGLTPLPAPAGLCALDPE